MNIIVDAFAAGLRVGTRTLAPKIAPLEEDAERISRELEIALFDISQLRAANSNAQTTDNTEATNNAKIGRLILITLLTDDKEGRIVVKETDTLGAAVAAGTVTAAVDQPAKAAVAVDPANPMAYVVTRLPLAPGDPDTLDVVVTLTDSATGLSDRETLRFEPGKAVGMTVDVEVMPIPAAAPPPPAVGSTVSIPANPSDSTSPVADHTVTAVSADGSMVTAEPVSGGPAVTVPTASVTAATT